MKTPVRRHVLSKWVKTQAVLQDDRVKSHIPETYPFCYETLKWMLHRHHMIYVKPDIGTYGNGVIKVEWNPGHPEQPYIYHLGKDSNSCFDVEVLFGELLNQTEKRRYLVQKGIRLLKYQDHPFDFRVMVQMNPGKKWETTGIIGRVAEEGKVVTNVHNGGRLETVECLLASYLDAAGLLEMMELLKEIGVCSARALHSQYKGIRDIGVDIALDQELYPWILEINTCPDPYIFRHFEDKRIFSKIIRYKRAFRR